MRASVPHEVFPTFFLVCAALLLPAVGAVASSSTYLLTDSFESYASGAFPSAWHRISTGTGSDYVTEEQSTSPTKSFQLWGAPNASAIAWRSFSTSDSVIGYEYSILIEAIGTGGPGRTDTPGLFSTADPARWGALYASVAFDHDTGWIKAEDGSKLAKWTPGTWYHVKVVLDRTASLYSVWVDGKLSGQDINTDSQAIWNINALALCSGHPSVRVWYDDVTVFSEAGAEPGVETGEWNIDFQGDANHNGTSGQSGPLAYTEVGAFWNVFEVAALREPWPTPKTASPSLRLRDSAGNEGAVTFSITGDAYGWAGMSGANPLTGDYLIIRNDFGVTNDPTNWRITGLTPNTTYCLTICHCPNNWGDRGLTIAARGASVSVLGLADQSVASMCVTADSAGTITGTASAAGYYEGDWAGLTIRRQEEAPSPLGSTVWNMDFQGDANHNGTNGQTGPVAYTEPGVFWNVFQVAALREPWPTPTSANPSLQVRDSTGAVSSVAFSIIGNACGWAGLANEDALIDDYLIVLNAPGIATDPTAWAIMGLVPNTVYTLTYYHHENGLPTANRGLVFDANGVSARVLGATGENVVSAYITSDGAGSILGMASAQGYAEGDWAGLTIQLAPSLPPPQPPSPAPTPAQRQAVAGIFITSLAPGSAVRDGPNNDAELYIKLRIGSQEYAIPRECYASVRSSGDPGWVFMSPVYFLPQDVWATLSLWEYDPGSGTSDDQVDISPDSSRDWTFLLSMDKGDQVLTSSGTGSNRATVSVSIGVSDTPASSMARKQAMEPAWAAWRDFASSLLSGDSPSAPPLLGVIAETVDIVQMLPSPLDSAATSYAAQEMYNLEYADELWPQVRQSVLQCASGARVHRALDDLVASIEAARQWVITRQDPHDPIHRQGDEIGNLLTLAAKADACRSEYESLLDTMLSSARGPAKAFVDSVFGVLSRLATNHAAYLGG